MNWFPRLAARLRSFFNGPQIAVTKDRVYGYTRGRKDGMR